MCRATMRKKDVYIRPHDAEEHVCRFCWDCIKEVDDETEIDRMSLLHLPDTCPNNPCARRDCKRENPCLECAILAESQIYISHYGQHRCDQCFKDGGIAYARHDILNCPKRKAAINNWKQQQKTKLCDYCFQRSQGQMYEIRWFRHPIELCPFWLYDVLCWVSHRTEGITVAILTWVFI